VPVDWAMMQNGNVLRALGERESGTEPLEEAVARLRCMPNCYRNGLAAEWVQRVCSDRDETQAKINQRWATE
jgi:hypothetical protein